jgi:hypothetical protein
MDKPQYHGEVTSVVTGERIVLSVRLHSNLFEDGRGYVIDLTVWDANIPGTDVFSAGILRAADARSLAEHLLNAAGLAAKAEAEEGTGAVGKRKLPTITLCGKTFVIDDQLRQLRNVENPMHCFDLDDPLTP